MRSATDDSIRHANTGVTSDISAIPSGLRLKEDSDTKAALAM
jgi:hypothetical protein